MKKSSCGVNRDGVLRGLRRFMMVLVGPYSCLFSRICKANAEVGLLFLKFRKKYFIKGVPGGKCQTSGECSLC